MFRYLDARGIQKRLAYENDLAEAIRNGEVTERTMFAEGESGAWQPAGRHPAYQRVAQMHGLKATSRPASRGAKPGVLGLVLALPAKAKVAGALVALLVVLGGFQLRSGMQREATLELLQQAMVDLGDGRPVAAEVLALEPPRDNTARMLWIRVRAEHDVRVEADSALAAHGVARFAPPADWMTVAYVRDADAYPEVGRHWEGYNRFHATYGARIPDRVNNRILKRGAEAGLRPPFINDLFERVEAELPSRMRPYHTRHALADAALSLHRALTQSDGRVAYMHDGVFEFEDGHATGLFNTFRPRVRDAVAELTGAEITLTAEQQAVLDGKPARRMGAADDARARREMEQRVQRALERPARRTPAN